jgi:hypothetical protein
VADRLVAAGLPDAEVHPGEFVRALPPGAFLAERRGVADMAVPVDLAGEGSAVPPEAVRLSGEVRQFQSELLPQDLPPLVAALVALRLVAEVRLQARRRAAQVTLEKWDESDALSGVPGLPPEHVRLDLPWLAPQLRELPQGEAERPESGPPLAHLLVARSEPLLPERRWELRLRVAQGPRPELQEPPVLPELPLAREPLRASARTSLLLRQSSPLRPLLPPPRDPGNACEPVPRARYRSSSSESFSRRRQSSAKSRSGLLP